MRTQRLAAVCAFVGLCLLAPRVGAQSPAARTTEAPDSMRIALVTYISGQSVYVGAGRADGVREGTALDVFRGGVVMATVRAMFLSSHSSSGEIVSSTAAPVVGDSVRYRPVVEPLAVVAADSTNTASIEPSSGERAPSWRRPVRGHVGVRYLSISQPNAANAGIVTQPSADVHLEGTNVGGTSIGFVIDARSRRTIGAAATDASALDRRTLVYEASISATHQSSGARLSIGRQYSTAISSVSLFDGMTAELNRPSWGMGLFSGMQPDVSTMSYSTAIRESGGYIQLHNRPNRDVPWSVTTGAVDSRDAGQLNREFGFAQVSLNARIVSLYATQEIDLNRGWKRAAGEPAVSPTSTFAMVSIQPTGALAIQGGVDNRRNVRLYRDYVNPETEFDDAFRQGVWGGATLSLYRRIRISGDARVSRGGPGGAASYYTGSLGVGPLSRLRVDARARSTSFTTEWASGWLHAWTIGLDPVDAIRLELTGGLREQRLAPGFSSADSTAAVATLANARWIGGSVDVSLGRSWYALVSWTRDGSGADLTNQLYAGLVLRF